MGIQVKDKVALVTGANRGIGRATVEALLAHGAAKVYLAVRDTNSSKALEEKYEDKVTTLHADLADQVSIDKLADAAGDVDILINNAGVLSPAGALSENAEDTLKFELEVNVFGVLRVVRAFGDILEANKGAFVQLNSVASIKNFSTLATYSASKAASYSLTQDLRTEWAEKGIHVLSVHPGPIDTDMARGAGIEMETESPRVVGEGIVQALERGDFHLFPDSVAKQFGAAYQGYSDAVVTAAE